MLCRLELEDSRRRRFMQKKKILKHQLSQAQKPKNAEPTHAALISKPKIEPN